MLGYLSGHINNIYCTKGWSESHASRRDSSNVKGRCCSSSDTAESIAGQLAQQLRGSAPGAPILKPLVWVHLMGCFQVRPTMKLGLTENDSDFSVLTGKSKTAELDELKSSFLLYNSTISERAILLCIVYTLYRAQNSLV